jgi:hypothetical protein
MLRIRTWSLLLVIALGGCASGATATTAPSAAATSAAIATASVPSVAPTPRPTPIPTPLPGCLPGCEQPNLTRPGSLPAGIYATRYFFGGQLRVTLPDVTWSSREDSTGELDLHQGDSPRAAIEFWLDVYPIIDPTRVPVPGYDGTAKALLDWIAANPNVKVTSRQKVTFGGLAGEYLDFERSPKAKNVDPNCPEEIRPCVNLVLFPQWDGPFGSAGPFKNRLYAVDAAWGGEPHAIYAMIWADTVPIFDDSIPAMAPIAEGAQFPADVHQ